MLLLADWQLLWTGWACPSASFLPAAPAADAIDRAFISESAETRADYAGIPPASPRVIAWFRVIIPPSARCPACEVAQRFCIAEPVAGKTSSSSSFAAASAAQGQKAWQKHSIRIHSTLALGLYQPKAPCDISHKFSCLSLSVPLGLLGQTFLS